jgi:hypothetical protein
MPPDRFPWQNYLYHSAGRQDIGYPRRRWAQNCFSLGTTRDSILELSQGGKVKVKLSLCLTNQALRYEGVWGSGYIDPHFLDLGTS